MLASVANVQPCCSGIEVAQTRCRRHMSDRDARRPFTSRQEYVRSSPYKSLRCAASKNPARQNKGFFSDADPEVEVLPMRKGLTGGVDPTKRGGRYEPEFIWQVDWKQAMDKAEAEAEAAAARQQAGASSSGSSAGATSSSSGGGEGGGGSKGYLSLGSKIDLNDMSVDLSAQLRMRPARKPAASSTQQQPRGPQYASVPVTRVEQKAWERGSGYAKRAPAVPPTNEVTEAEQAAKLAEERARYETLKAELQAWAAGLSAACLAATFAFYGRETAASYGVGALGGLVYLRLLNRSVDAVGGGSIGGALGQPRLLIPLILALGYSRYNQLMADDVGLTLQLLPMLAGFFTYKGAVMAKTALDFARELTSSAKGEQEEAGGGSGGGEGSGGAGSGGGAAGEASVDRAFRNKMLRG